ncbi:hypothetical protein EGK69_017075 [Citrobacter freundii]|nr:hypothetical protein EGK69_017075 [Citrobacter freundii]
MGSNIIELAKLGHERAAELKASCGAVDVRSLAQLISDLATQLEVQLVRGNALAAENAGLKNPENWLSQSDYGYEASEVATQNGATEDESLRAGMIAIINRIGTPATDAFLAEVRAQGVEMMAAEADQLMNEFGDDSYKVMVTADLQRFANAFAAQLRKGVQS